MLEAFESELKNAQPLFRLLSPSPKYIVSSAYPWLVRSIYAGEFFRGWFFARREGASYASLIGASVAHRTLNIGLTPVRREVIRLHQHMRTIDHDWSRKNGMGGHSWITKPGRHEMIVVFHDANRAGPHIDVHIGRLSLVYRVKPETYSQLKYNSNGYLTAKSQELLMSHVRSEIENGSRVPQNLDHSYANARSSWVKGDPTATHYGAGVTRQVISVSNVDVLKAHADGPIEFYAPVLNSTRPLYLYRLYSGEGKSAPICVFGVKVPKPPKMEERLHLKLVHPEDIDTLSEKADMSTSTAKYDGSSAYFRINSKGMTLWSPRQSKKTGEQIEYTQKLGVFANIRSDQEIVGMGELVFVEKSPWWRRDKGNVYLPQAVGSGFLNSHDVLPSTVKPELRIYRIDKVDGKRVGDTDFWTNRLYQERVASLDPFSLKVVELMDPVTAKSQGFEGVVATKPDASINEGFKVKWWTDAHDWVINKVSFKEGPSGKVAGVIEAQSLESGRTFNLGPGQVGNEALTRDMMAHPHKYEGGVIKVHSRHGHEGRASKVLSFHDDKGISVYE